MRSEMCFLGFYNADFQAISAFHYQDQMQIDYSFTLWQMKLHSTIHFPQTERQSSL